MRKGIAIPYVIALILGVAVIALLGIWFVVTGGRFSGQASDTYCQAQQVEYCSRSSSGGTGTNVWASGKPCNGNKYGQPDTTIPRPTPLPVNHCDNILSKGPVAT